MESELMRNEVLNRVAIDTLGYEPGVIIFARNNYERIERIADWLIWLAVGMFAPLLVLKPLSKWVTQKLQRQHPVTNANVLTTSFKDLDPAAWADEAGKRLLAEKLGLEARHIPQHLVPLARKVSRAKIGFITIDLAFMAFKGLVYFLGRNAMTEKLSKTQGFVGEFNDATKQQLHDNSEEYRREKVKNRNRTFILAGISLFGLPAFLWALTKSPAKVGKGIVGRLKKLLPAFDYHKIIYQSRWVLLWDAILMWNTAGFLAARSHNEKREQVVRSVVMDSLFFFGDSVIQGITGWWLQHRSRYAEKFKNIPLFNRGWLGVPWERRADDIMADVKKLKLPHTEQEAMHGLVDKISRWNFRIGLLSTSAILGVGMTLINNWYTRQKVLTQKQQYLAANQHLYATPLSRRPAFFAYLAGQ